MQNNHDIYLTGLQYTVIWHSYFTLGHLLYQCENATVHIHNIVVICVMLNHVLQLLSVNKVQTAGSYIMITNGNCYLINGCYIQRGTCGFLQLLC